jgi:hypothetical protein
MKVSLFIEYCKGHNLEGIVLLQYAVLHATKLLYHRINLILFVLSLLNLGYFFSWHILSLFVEITCRSRPVCSHEILDHSTLLK